MAIEPIPKDEIAKMPLLRFQGKTHIVASSKRVADAVDVLKKEKVLGFDTETRPSFKKGQTFQVALLQLSTKDEVFLFRLQQCGLPEPLTKLLSDEAVKKVGVAIRDDIIALQKMNDFTPGGFVELADVATERGVPEKGLRGLVARVLDKRISKGAKLTNWEAATLTPAQITYAATDAFVGREIYINWFPQD